MYLFQLNIALKQLYIHIVTVVREKEGRMCQQEKIPDSKLCFYLVI